MSIKNTYVISDNTDVLKSFCGEARKISDCVTAVVFADKASAEGFASCGADKIISCPLDACAAEDYSGAIANIIKADESATIFVYNSVRGKVITAKLGVYLDTAVISGVGEFTVVDDKVMSEKMVYGGAGVRKERSTTAYTIMSFGDGVMKDETDYGKTAEIIEIAEKPVVSVKCTARKPSGETSVNLAVAKRIVDIGRGLKNEADMDQCRKLASIIGGEIGCSRPIAENNKWLPKAYYIGVTGVVIKPELCLMLGISGEVQHMVGINKSKVIVAINKDKNAAVFKQVDFGLVGEIEKVLPALIERLS